MLNPQHTSTFHWNTFSLLLEKSYPLSKFDLSPCLFWEAPIYPPTTQNLATFEKSGGVDQKLSCVALPLHRIMPGLYTFTELASLL